jgi:hypothetical protein
VERGSDRPLDTLIGRIEDNPLQRTSSSGPPMLPRPNAAIVDRIRAVSMASVPDYCRPAHPGQPAGFLYEFVNHLRQKSGRNAFRGAQSMGSIHRGF